MTSFVDPLLGRVVDQRYRVDDELARGGMATVFRARDLRLDRPVALKVMRGDLARDDTFVRRFVHEARAAARLQHPHIVSVYDQGEDEGTVFLAMELVDGRTLRDVIRDGAPLSTRAALRLLVPVAEALAAAHAVGMVHRDVKPENVLLGYGPSSRSTVKVADFGLARVEGAGHATTELLWATVAYLAPEQVEHGTSDPRTDVYAVGLLLFELLTGRKAFPGADPVRVAYEHVHGGVPHVRDLVPSVPAAVERLILRASASDPGDRPEDGTALLAELRQLERSLSDAELDAAPVREETITVPATDDLTQLVGGPGASHTRQLPRTHGIPPARPASAGPGGPVHAGRDGGYARTTGNRVPSRRPDRPRRGGRAAGWVLGLLLLLLLAAAGYGYWYLTSGPAVHSPMPVVVGLTEDEARTALDGEELDPVVRRAYSETVPDGVVLAADQDPGTELRHGTDVTLTVSRGPERYAVPRLDGLTLDQVRAELEEEQLTLGEQLREFSDAVPKDVVVRSDPEAGTPLPPGSPVTVVVSDGPAPVDVPDVRGRTQEEATAALQQAQLTVEVAPDRVFDDAVPEGSVVSQDPGPGQAQRGTTVRIVISKGPELVEVPDVVGRQFDRAAEELTQLGLEVVREDVRGGFFGTVRDQSVKPGEKVPPGTRIVLAVV
ncbi:Stk1 family PASTA domain-containing Ser/Thr kinase [Ornithinimicrobium tianjinense]|uniref:non-specific serine/threonine protein kinase n=1 Tax=Ornithinimicrobium tianjinense TaxID=1195761 RepID=A0A917F218_9MICO|nr:Stk1 family PASTA domain-containing Ser/Thr kinase [Ornithinimicrobium tianjinense]GGF45255.1 serine/threonine protein kinase [Ornithinimicrobium tianjinense]